MVTALAERDALVLACEARAGAALRSLTKDEGLSLREAVTWCGGLEQVSVREATRLRKIHAAEPVTALPRQNADEREVGEIVRYECTGRDTRHARQPAPIDSRDRAADRNPRLREQTTLRASTRRGWPTWPRPVPRRRWLRFAFGLTHGVEATADVPVLGRRCDNPLCQPMGPGHVWPGVRRWVSERGDGF